LVQALKTTFMKKKIPQKTNASSLRLQAENDKDPGSRDNRDIEA
jgi:hypothetical protein